MSTIVYAYGAKPPLNPAPVLEQLWQANQYYNKLVEIERGRRAETQSYLATVLPPEKLVREAELKTLIDNAFAAVREDRKKTRSRVKMDDAKTAEVAEWKAELKTLQAALKELRVATRIAKPAACCQGKCSKRKRCRKCLDLIDTMDLGPLGNIDRAAHSASLAARAEYASGKLYHGTYVAVDDAAKSSFAKTRHEKPKYRTYDGNGCVGVQLQGGLPISEIATGTRMQVLNMEQTDWRPPGPNPNLTQWRLLRLRIASDGRAPVWAEFPFRQHRPLPEGALILWVYVHRKRIGTTFRWSVQFTISVPPGPPMRHPAPDATCGIDIGWKKLDEGLRVAIVGTYGGVEECVLPQRVVSKFAKAEDIRHIRDKNFNIAVSEAVKCRDYWPEWMREMCKDILHWRAPAKLAKVVLRWRENRFDGDATAFPILAAWRMQDRHLLEMESHLRQRGLNSRKDCYRKFSIDLCRRFGNVSIQGFALDECAKLPPEDEAANPLHLEARNNRFRAALSELRLALKQASLKTGSELVCH